MPMKGSVCPTIAGDLVLVLLHFVPIASNAQINFSGDWIGRLNDRSSEITLKLTIHPELTAGTISSSLGLQNAPVGNLTIQMDSIGFHLSDYGVQVRGKAVNGNIDAIWHQGRTTTRILFERVKTESANALSQSLGFKEEEVEVTTTDNIKLSGTLVTPQEAIGKVPAVVLLTVAGPNDRDQTIGNHKPFKTMAEFLALHGIASIRLDDRGVGKSQGSLSTADFEQLRKDALAGIETLRTREEINPRLIGAIGNSEGSIIAGLTASSNEDISFVIMLGAVGAPLTELLSERIDKMNGIYRLSQDQKEELLGYFRAVENILIKNLPKEMKTQTAKQTKSTKDL